MQGCRTDQLELYFLFSATLGAHGWWVGTTDLHEEGVWKWESGDPILASLWQPGQPNNNNGDQHYGFLLMNDNYKLHDASDGDHPFICEYHGHVIEN